MNAGDLRDDTAVGVCPVDDLGMDAVDEPSHLDVRPHRATPARATAASAT